MLKASFLLLPAFFFLACTHAGNNPAEAVNTETLQTNSKAKILNGIIVQEKGSLEVSRAFLSDEAGTLLDADNKVRKSETVYLNLMIKKGWISENGQVSLGAMQRITTNTGEPVLSSKDLFAGKTKINQADAAHLRLKTRITNTRPEIEHFLVYFHIWDKQGDGEIKGLYKLFIVEK